MTPTDFDQVKDLLGSGDIVLFAGTGDVSRLIQRATGSPWSHVGMVIASPLGPLLWESTTLNDVPDVSTGRLVAGVQTVCLEQKVRQYAGGIAIRQIQPTLHDGELAGLYALRRKLAGRPYERDACQLLRAAWDEGILGRVLGLGRNAAADLSSLFCSELVAEALMTLGRLEADPPSNEYVPADFAADARPALPLRNCRLGPALLVRPLPPLPPLSPLGLAI